MATFDARLHLDVDDLISELNVQVIRSVAAWELSSDEAVGEKSTGDEELTGLTESDLLLVCRLHVSNVLSTPTGRWF